MKNLKRVLGLLTVLVAIGMISMIAFAQVDDAAYELDEQTTQAQADDSLVYERECTGDCEGPIQARDGTGTGMQKRLGNGEGRVNGEGKGLNNGEGRFLSNGEGQGQGRGNGYRGGR